MEFLDRINNKGITNFRNGGVILMRSRSNFRVPVPVGRIMIMRRSSCTVNGVVSTGVSTGRGTRRRTGARLRRSDEDVGTVLGRRRGSISVGMRRCSTTSHRVAFMGRVRRHANNGGLDTCLTFMPVSVGSMAGAHFRSCVIGSDGCCLHCACLMTRNGT